MLELLEPPQRLAAEQQDRGPLRRESVLVNVGCKTRHAWHREVEVRDGIAFHPREGGEETAQAGVHVQPHPPRLANRTEPAHGVRSEKLRVGKGGVRRWRF